MPQNTPLLMNAVISNRFSFASKRILKNCNSSCMFYKLTCKIVIFNEITANDALYYKYWHTKIKLLYHFLKCGPMAFKCSYLLKCNNLFKKFMNTLFLIVRNFSLRSHNVNGFMFNILYGPLMIFLFKKIHIRYYKIFKN